MCSSDLLVRAGAASAIVRAEVVRGGGSTRIEAEIRATGRNRILVNGQALPRRRDLVEGLRATVFSPDDLELVKGGPALRRGFLDDLLSASAPRYESLRSDYERVLRQRNALLKGGVRDEEARTTLEVFDAQLARAGADVNAQEKWNGQTALMWAAADGDGAMVTALLELGAKLDTKSNAGTTAFMLAVRKGDQIGRAHV